MHVFFKMFVPRTVSLPVSLNNKHILHLFDSIIPCRCERSQDKSSLLLDGVGAHIPTALRCA